MAHDRDGEIARSFVRYFAGELDGLEYPIPAKAIKAINLWAEAKSLGIVFALGMSDDLFCFYGAISGEMGVQEEPVTAFVGFDPDGTPGMGDEFAIGLTLTRHDPVDPYYWTIETKIPHETFGIIDEGELFSRGVVFSVGSIRELAGTDPA